MEIISSTSVGSDLILYTSCILKGLKRFILSTHDYYHPIFRTLMFPLSFFLFCLFFLQLGNEAVSAKENASLCLIILSDPEIYIHSSCLWWIHACSLLFLLHLSWRSDFLFCAEFTDWMKLLLISLVFFQYVLGSSCFVSDSSVCTLLVACCQPFPLLLN